MNDAEKWLGHIPAKGYSRNCFLSNINKYMDYGFSQSDLGIPEQPDIIIQHILRFLRQITK